MRVCGVPPPVIESPKTPMCHPEREGGGWDGREGSPHESRRNFTVSAEILRSPRTHPPLASKKVPVFMRARSVSPLVIESPKPPTCHPEREGGGSGGREGSPHKSRCRSTVIAEILRSP